MAIRLLLPALATVLCAAALSASPAAAAPIIAIGDQKADMFGDPRLDWLGIRHARLVVPWYLETGGSDEERERVRQWLDTARRSGIRPVVGFGHGWIGWTRLYLPTAREFRRAFNAFHRRYPWVRDYITWNEANHCSQPTCRRPRRTARFYDAIVDRCPRCKVVAAAILTAGNMRWWIDQFRRAARHRIRIWGLHNYGDVNRLQWSGTREFLRLTRGPVWITESGGVVYRSRYGGQDPFPVGTRRAGRVTRYLLRKARRNPRFKRLYLYHWNVDRPKPQWDSGLIDWAGRARASFAALARYLGRNPRNAPRRPEPAAAPAPAPSEPPPPSPEPPPPSEPEPPPPEEEPPPCGVLPVCPRLAA